MKVALILPARNEIEGLKVFLSDFIGCGKFSEIIVIDGRSTDGSAAYARSLGCTVVEQTSAGMRAGYLQSYGSFSGDAVIVFSPDGNSLPEAIPEIVDRLSQGYDMVIASRYKDGAESRDDTLLSGIGNWVFTFLISRFGFRYTDAMVMYRGYRIDVPKRLGLDVIRSEKYERTFGRHVSWEPLMSIRAAKAGLRIAEVGFDEPKRIDQTGAGALLPASRISHFKAGFYCFLQLIEELFVWNWVLSDGKRTTFRRWRKSGLPKISTTAYRL